MIDDEPTLSPPCRKGRQGDDTHWWKAYEAHSRAAPALGPHVEPPAGAAGREGLPVEERAGLAAEPGVTPDR